jgi:hypothetical protein
VKEIADISGAFKDNLIAWLGDAGNGIGKLFAKEGHFETVCVKKSDGTEFCANGDQLVAALGAASGAATASVSPAPQKSQSQDNLGTENATSTEPVSEDIPPVESGESAESEPVRRIFGT